MTDPAAILMALFGLALIVFAPKVTGFFLRGLEWQKRAIGGWTVDWQIRVMASRGAIWFVRLFGALILLGFVVSAFGLGKGAAR